MACGYLVVTAPFVKKTVIFPLKRLSILVENQLFVKARVNFWLLNSILMSVLYYLCYCGFIIHFFFLSILTDFSSSFK